MIKKRKRNLDVRNKGDRYEGEGKRVTAISLGGGERVKISLPKTIPTQRERMETKSNKRLSNLGPGKGRAGVERSQE